VVLELVGRAALSSQQQTASFQAQTVLQSPHHMVSRRQAHQSFGYRFNCSWLSGLPNLDQGSRAGLCDTSYNRRQALWSEEMTDRAGVALQLQHPTQQRLKQPGSYKAPSSTPPHRILAHSDPQEQQQQSSWLPIRRLTTDATQKRPKPQTTKMKASPTTSEAGRPAAEQKEANAPTREPTVAHHERADKRGVRPCRTETRRTETRGAEPAQPRWEGRRVLRNQFGCVIS
jgi:hypothetical protein